MAPRSIEGPCTSAPPGPSRQQGDGSQLGSWRFWRICCAPPYAPPGPQPTCPQHDLSDLNCSTCTWAPCRPLTQGRCVDTCGSLPAGESGHWEAYEKADPSPRTPAPAHPTNKSGHPGPAGGTDPPTLWKALPTTHATRGARAGLSPDAEPDGTCRGIARADHALALAFGKRAPGRAKTIAKCPPGPGGQQGRSPAHLGKSSPRPLRPRPRS